MSTLEDLRVLDLSDAAGGAYCARLFADYGADVIAVEPPGGSKLREAGLWDELARNKRSVTLDITTDIGRQIFLRMTEQANVIVETFASGLLDSLGLGFADLYRIKRRIILVSVPPDPDAGGTAERHAGLNAFAAATVSAHHADAYEVPQHIVISIAECASAGLAAGGGLDPGDPPFTVSTVERVESPAPSAGEHNVEFFGGEVGVDAEELARLREEGVL